MHRSQILRRTIAWITVTVWVSSGVALSAPDEEPAAGSSSLEEIIVTAQKRSESVQKIPIAIAAITDKTLEAQGISDFAGLQALVPGLNVAEQVGQARLTLRGVGVDNISTGAESSVAFNQDGVFYARSAGALASFYDVSRVEVLRGPQGTLYGRNATGGSVNIITNRPSRELSAAGNLTVGNYDTINVDGFVNGGLSSTISGRLSFQTQEHNGYGKNLTTGTDIDTKHSKALRGQLLFEPTEDLSILAAGDYYRSQDRSNEYHYFGAAGQSAPGVPITPTALLLGGFAASSPRDIAAARDPSSYQEFSGGRLDARYKLTDALELKFLTAYRRSDFAVQTDISPISVELFPVFFTEHSNEFTQELQLNVDIDRNKVVAGLFYLNEKLRGRITGPYNLMGIGGPDLFIQGYYSGGSLDTDASAAYAQDDFSVTDKMRITFGGRYSRERKSVNDQSEFDFARPYSPTNTPLSAPQVDSVTFSAFTPKVGIDFDLAAQTLVYASFSKGFKAGTYNLGADTPPLQPEKIDAYEAGMKSTVADGAVRSNLAAFYYKYKDLQVGQVRGQVLVLENAAAARIYGIEEELTVKAAQDFTVGLNAAWLHARFRSYTSVDQARTFGDGVTVDPKTGAPAFNLAGNTLSQSPNYTVTLSAEYDFRLPGATLDLRGESYWSDRVYFSAFDRNVLSQPAYNTQNAFLTYEPNGGSWHVGAYVNNIGNRTILSAGQVATGLIGFPAIGFVNPPRTYGVTVGFRFH